jgi:hypothetical protein
MEVEKIIPLTIFLVILTFLIVLVWFLIKDKSLKVAMKEAERKAELEFTNALIRLKKSPENYEFYVKSRNIFTEPEGWHRTDFFGALAAVLKTCKRPMVGNYAKPAKFCVHINEAAGKVYIIPEESSFNMGLIQ